MWRAAGFKLWICQRFPRSTFIEQQTRVLSKQGHQSRRARQSVRLALLRKRSGLLGGRCAIRWLFLIKSRTEDNGPGPINLQPRSMPNNNGRSHFLLCLRVQTWMTREWICLFVCAAPSQMSFTTNCDWFQNCSLLTSQIRIRVGEYDFSSSGEPLAHEERGVIKKVVHPKWVSLFYFFLIVGKVNQE